MTTFLLFPVLWLALIWVLNRHAATRPQPDRWRVFWLTGASPLLFLLVWCALGLMRFGYDPKAMVILIEIGLPASLIALAFAGWGSGGMRRSRGSRQLR